MLDNTHNIDNAMNLCSVLLINKLILVIDLKSCVLSLKQGLELKQFFPVPMAVYTVNRLTAVLRGCVNKYFTL